MQLYITTTSPYARMARIVILEKRLAGRVEIIVAETRRGRAQLLPACHGLSR